ncbi:MAG: peptide ABC transporter permease [Desulfitibacter sp. BRH_c19]|nr:MAG: peptide ABC transporter permease [Desulfitibacter sp. BRH_c19]
MRYLIRKVSSSLITLFVIITLTFILIHSIPGSPFETGKRLPDAIAQNLNYKYQLDAPLGEQYLNYLKGLSKGDLGSSIKQENRTVNSIIRDGFPISALLGISSILIALSFGIMLGCITAIYRNKWLDMGVSLFTTLGISIPGFVLAGLLVQMFAVKLQWFPPALWHGPISMILPVIALSLLPMAIITRLIKASLFDVLGQNYMQTARAKGLPYSKVVFKHGLRNSLFPVLSYLGPAVAAIVTGSFIIESIFSIPGMGKWFVISVINRDYTVVVGLTIFYSTLLICINIIVDIAYAILDPRVKVWDRGIIK